MHMLPIFFTVVTTYSLTNLHFVSVRFFKIDYILQFNFGQNYIQSNKIRADILVIMSATLFEM